MSDKSGTDPVGKGMAGLQNAASAVQQVGGQAQEVGSQAATHAKEVAQEAQSRAASLAGAVGERVTSAAESQKDSLADRIEGVAQAVHRSGEQFEGQQDWIAHFVERGADELSALATTMRTNDLQGLLGSLQDLARRQPALFAGASVAAGIALARIGRVAVAGASKADLPTLPGGQP